MTYLSDGVYTVESIPQSLLEDDFVKCVIIVKTGEIEQLYSSFIYKVTDEEILNLNLRDPMKDVSKANLDFTFDSE